MHQTFDMPVIYINTLNKCEMVYQFMPCTTYTPCMLHDWVWLAKNKINIYASARFRHVFYCMHNARCVILITITVISWYSAAILDVQRWIGSNALFFRQNRTQMIDIRWVYHCHAMTTHGKCKCDPNGHSNNDSSKVPLLWE